MTTKTDKTKVDRFAGYRNMGVVKSRHFESIMLKYDAVGSVMAMNAFHREHIAPIDPKISLDAWKRFMRRFRKDTLIDTNKILQSSENKIVNSIVQEEKTLNKLSMLFDFTLDEILKDPEKMKGIPVETRASWFFAAMRARDARLRTGIKKRADDREQTAYDELMNEAQYSGDAIDLSSNPITSAQDIPADDFETMRDQVHESNAPMAVIAFKPEDLEKL